MIVLRKELECPVCIKWVFRNWTTQASAAAASTTNTEQRIETEPAFGLQCIENDEQF